MREEVCALAIGLTHFSSEAIGRTTAFILGALGYVWSYSEVYEGTSGRDLSLWEKKNSSIIQHFLFLKSVASLQPHIWRCFSLHCDKQKTLLSFLLYTLYKKPCHVVVPEWIVKLPIHSIPEGQYDTVLDKAGGLESLWSVYREKILVSW